jgi:riboflavin kinase/FMN adenylyltransferase
VFVEQVGEGTAVSASSIRALICQGEVEAANALLGYRWFVEGTVVHGAKRGRELGYPTANLEVDPGCGLRHGIYAVRATVDGFPGPIGGVASFGRRPMFDNGPPLLETFLFDFSGDLYGRLMKVEFLALLRGEETFDSLEALIAQMDRDSLAARAILAQPVDPAVPSLLG